ncbi:MAG: response regulator transcription factor [Crocinitomicaceae bacterium]|jgi:DNA-binding NarL/FixJ family response regulator|nr:response regulator transcription factor [Crocinitomicaceae bacterium]
MSNLNASRVIIVDDHLIFSQSLEAILNRYPFISVVSTFQNGDRLFDFMDRNRVDVVLMDVQIPKVDGIKLTANLKERYPKSKIIILSMLTDAKTIAKAEEAGADCYVFKGEDIEKLVQTIVDCSPNEVSKQVKSIPTNQTRDERLMSTEFNISKRELQVLKSIIEGMTNEQIADVHFISPFTVKTHRANILRKLGVRNTAQLVSLYHSM